MRPQMLVVAGPPGSGKSSLLRPDESDLAYFNADERARDLNRGSGHNISPGIRSVVNQELEHFILDHIRRGRSFSYETTLRTAVTYDQARLAKAHGFDTRMQYVALGSVEESIARVRARAVQGGHSAPPERIREIYEASLSNLPRALKDFDMVRVFDNSDSASGDGPALVLETVEGQLVSLVSQPPAWVVKTLLGTEYDLRLDLRKIIGGVGG